MSFLSVRRSAHLIFFFSSRRRHTRLSGDWSFRRVLFRSLFGEFRARAGADLHWLEGRAYPYAQNIPYAPLIDLLSREWGIEDTDRPDRVRSKIAAGVAAVLDSPAYALPLLYHLFHLEQDAGVVIERESFQDRLLQGVRDLLAGLVH